MRFARADMVLYFRFNRLLCLWRILKRRLYKDPHISDRAEKCPEILRLRLIRYLWGFDQRVCEMISDLRTKYPDVKFYELHRDKELQQFLDQMADFSLARRSSR